MKSKVFRLAVMLLLAFIFTNHNAVLAAESSETDKEKAKSPAADTTLAEQMQVLQEKIHQLEALVEQQQRIIELWQRQNTTQVATPTLPPNTGTEVKETTKSAVAGFDTEQQKKLDTLYKVFGQYQLSGDLRLRYDGQSNQGFDSTLPLPNRNRVHMRARVQLIGTLHDKFDWGLRVASGNFVNPNGTNQTFTDFFNRKPVGFDRYFIRYNSKTEPWGFTLQGGKFDFPWKRTELTFDNDLQPEGAAETLYYKGKGRLKELRLVAFQLPFSEDAAGKDAYLLGGQLLGTVASSSWSATAGATFLNFNHADAIVRTLNRSTTQVGGGLQAGTTNRVRRDAMGNITGFVANFNVLDTVGELTYNRYPRYPITFVLNYAHNFSQRLKQLKEQDAYWTEVKVGRLKEKGDWEFTYTFARIEQDAVLASFNFDDFLTSNSINSRATAGYMINNNVYLQFLGIFSTRANTLPGRDSRTLRRFQFDVNYRF
jgi:hypothetical protein